MRKGKLGVWLAVAAVFVSALAGANAVSGGRWQVTLRLMSADVVLAASPEHVSLELKL